jgi:hypothetical protein
MGIPRATPSSGSRSEAILVIVAVATLVACDIGTLSAAVRQARAMWSQAPEPAGRAR